MYVNIFRYLSIVFEINQHPPVTILNVTYRLIKLLKFDFFLFATRVLNITLSLLNSLVFLNFEYLTHLKSFIFEFF